MKAKYSPIDPHIKSTEGRVHEKVIIAHLANIDRTRHVKTVVPNTHMPVFVPLGWLISPVARYDPKGMKNMSTASMTAWMICFNNTTPLISERSLPVAYSTGNLLRE
jgi:hypothetical protein